eukprot:XP_001704377.1 Hypothetical protein GL50803_31762 [Giardia lamblia ATCC 50803]
MTYFSLRTCRSSVGSVGIIVVITGALCCTLTGDWLRSSLMRRSFSLSSSRSRVLSASAFCACALHSESWETFADRSSTIACRRLFSSSYAGRGCDAPRGAEMVDPARGGRSVLGSSGWRLRAPNTPSEAALRGRRPSCVTLISVAESACICSCLLWASSSRTLAFVIRCKARDCSSLKFTASSSLCFWTVLYSNSSFRWSLDSTDSRVCSSCVIN